MREKDKEKILIIGTDGQIGKALKQYLNKKKVTTFGTTRRRKNKNKNMYYFDLEKPDFKYLENKFTSAVICASTTNISLIEKEPHKHQIINVKNTIKLIKELSKKNIYIVYLSSNSVFKGKKQFYKYNDKTAPNNLYGRFKVQIEEYITTKLKNKSCVLRLTKVITKKTPFIERWKKEAKNGKSIETFANKYLSPINIGDVVDKIHHLIKQKECGIFQLGGSEEISYTEYAYKFFKKSIYALNLISTKIDKNEKIFNSLKTHLPKINRKNI
jgi:dTDP-4-dehydrorhamnose reductase